MTCSDDDEDYQSSESSSSEDDSDESEYVGSESEREGSESEEIDEEEYGRRRQRKTATPGKRKGPSGTPGGKESSHTGESQNGTPGTRKLPSVTAERAEILRASYKEDSSYPFKNSERLNELCEKTGMEYQHIQSWFKRQREKAQRMNNGQQASYEKEEHKNKNSIEKSGGYPYSQSGSMSADDTHSNDSSLEIVDVIDNDDADDLEVVFSSGSLGDVPSPATPPSRKLSVAKRPSAVNAPATLRKATKCPICDSICTLQAMVVVSLKEAGQMDIYFSSSLVHFLTYTRAVRVCLSHAVEYSTSKA